MFKPGRFILVSRVEYQSASAGGTEPYPGITVNRSTRIHQMPAPGECIPAFDWTHTGTSSLKRPVWQCVQ
ncbi:hypothetical protein OkiPb00504_11720 [Escherichia coli]